MAASIQTTFLNSPGGTPVGPVTTDTSRDDLRKGYQVVCSSVYDASTYSWTLAFTPDSAGPTAASGSDYAGTASQAALLSPEGSTSKTCRFNADWDGSYLLRLVVDAGLPTEDTIFLRFRSLTRFGELKLVAGGERRDSEGVVPHDASTEGWAGDQNSNIQRLLALVRRVSVSGRVLYVDANRGRDYSEDQNDPDNIIRMPGPDSAARDETGIRTAAEGFADFSSINDAITYAAAAATRGEAALSASDPYVIVIAPGYYEETLALQPFIHLVGGTPSGAAYPNPSATSVPTGAVVVRAVSTLLPTTYHTLIGSGDIDEYSMLVGLTLESTVAADVPVFLVDGATLVATTSTFHKRADSGGALTVGGTNPGWAQVGDSVLLGPTPASIAPGENPCALHVVGEGHVSLLKTAAVGANGIVAPTVGAEVFIGYSPIQVAHTSGWGYLGVAHLDMEHSYVGITSGATGGAVGVGVGAAAASTAEEVEVAIKNSYLGGRFRVESAFTTNTVRLTTAAAALFDPSHLELVGTNIYRYVRHIVGEEVRAFDRVTAAMSPYTLPALTSIVACETGPGPITVQLPLAPPDGRVVTIKDSNGSAAATNITVQAAAGETFEGGGASYTINADWGSATFYYYGSTWFSI